ncbi:MAG: response regulator transcription factor [Christensenellales bacterium]
MKDANRVLIIDDDRNICQLIEIYLKNEGYGVSAAYRGDEGLAMIKKDPPDIVILDIMMPGMDGYQVCREIRSAYDIPIIMLTAKSDTFDKVLGLELGADDYLSKPFDPKELIARIKAVQRRYSLKDASSQEEKVTYENLEINLSNYTVTYFGQSIELPPKELELLFFLATHANKVYTREQLLEHVWGFDFFGDTRTVDVHIKRLREKLGKRETSWEIKTVWGVGYKFEVKQ